MTIKQTVPEEKSVHKTRLARSLAILIVLCFGIGLALADHANYISPDSTTTNRFAYDNAAWVFIAAEGILAYILKRLQGGVYWFNWLQLNRPVLDERQKHVRHIVFEHAYLVSLVVLFIAVTIASVPIQYATTWHTLQGPVTQGPGSFDMWSRVIWAACILNVALPSILATWRKDS